MSDVIMQISIPPDNDGYVLFQCPNCREFFKISSNDYNDDGVLEIFCPACGLVGDNYMTEDVIELAQAMAKNFATELIYNEMKKWEKQFKSSFTSFKTGKKPTPETETPIQAGIEALSITTFPCCHRTSKIKPLLKITGCYCPFCGGKEYETE